MNPVTTKIAFGETFWVVKEAPQQTAGKPNQYLPVDPKALSDLLTPFAREKIAADIKYWRRCHRANDNLRRALEQPLNNHAHPKTLAEKYPITICPVYEEWRLGEKKQAKATKIPVALVDLHDRPSRTRSLSIPVTDALIKAGYTVYSKNKHPLAPVVPA